MFHYGKSILSCLAFLTCLIFNVQVEGAEGVDKLEHNLNSYLSYAIEHNPIIEASRFKSRSQLEAITIAKKIPDPKITAAYFISEVETRVGPQKAKIGLSQMIPWPGKIKSKRDIQKSKYQVLEKNESEIIANVLTSVRSLYAKLFLTGQSIKKSKESLKLLRQLESVLLTKYSTGTINQAALIKVQVEMSLVEDNINSLKSKGVIEKEKLRSLLNVSQEIKIPFPDSLPRLRVDQQIIDNVEDVNPALQKKKFQRVAAKENVRLAKKSFAPDLMLMTDYVFTDKVDPAMGNPNDNGKDPWIIGASINLPLTIGKKRSEIEKAGFELKSVNSAIKNIENSVVSDLVAAKERYDYSINREKLYKEDLVPKAKQVLMLTEENYKNGNASILDFIDAQRMVLSLDITLIKEQVKRELASAEIDKLYGNLFTKLELDKQEM